MPFESKAQARYMFLKHPKIAKEFAGKTEDIGDLPEHKKKAAPDTWIQMSKKQG